MSCTYRALTAIAAAVLGACAQQPPPQVRYSGDAPSLAQVQVDARAIEAARRHPNAQPRVRPQFPEQAPPPLAEGQKLPEPLYATRRAATKLSSTYVDWQRPENHYGSRYGYGYGYRPLSVGIGWDPYGYGYGYGRPFGWGGYYGYGRPFGWGGGYGRYGYGLSLGLGAPLWGSRGFGAGYHGGWGHRHSFGARPHVRWMDAGGGRRRW